MTTMKNQVHGVPMITVWYAQEKIKEDGIIIYRQAKFKPNGEYTVFDTLETDLQQSEEDIISKISKNGRYEIRRAEKEGVKTQIKVGNTLTDEDIKEFCNFFVEFWQSKGVVYEGKEELYKEISAYANQGKFAITQAGIDGHICVYHTYILCEDTVRLYHSASLYRVDENVPKKIVGMANRYLHKEDMLYFKQTGIKIYDWGGAGRDEAVKSITEFKESFGGVPKQHYDFTQVNGVKAKAVSMLSNLKNKL